MIKILLIGSVPPPYNGSTVYFKEMLDLLKKMSADKFSLLHLDTSDHRSLSNIGKIDLINICLGLKNFMELIIYLIKFKPDMVYIPISASIIPYFRDGMFILITSWFSHAKIIVHLHGGGYFRDEFYNRLKPILKSFVKHSLSKVNSAIVLGKGLRYVFIGLVKNIYVLPNGSNIKINKIRKHSGKNVKIKISYLGNLMESKGILDLIHAAKIVINKYKNVEFKLAGAWRNQEQSTKIRAYNFIKENKLEKYIKFCGVVSGRDKKEFLVTTDIFVFPTWYPFEGFPLVILEAMAAGCPVITTKNVGVIQEIVVDGNTGILINKKSPKQIADAIIRLIENQELRRKMGLNGKKRFEAYFTMEKNVENIISIFNSVINC
ncbi:MAG: glycosyltransferase family 4 protein [Promethearchaeota archaeon]